MEDEYAIHGEEMAKEQEQQDKNKACRRCLGMTAFTLTLGIVAALLVAGWSAGAPSRSRQGFLDAAAGLDFVEDLGYIYIDQNDNNRVYVFTSLCEDNSGVLASTWGLDACGTYDAVCPVAAVADDDEDEGGYSFCVCGAAWKVTVVDNREVLYIKTPYCTMSQTFMEEYRGVVIYADLALQNRGYVVSPIAVDLSSVNADGATFVQDVADIIISSDDYQSIVKGN
jgi:hypothetical protein